MTPLHRRLQNLERGRADVLPLAIVLTRDPDCAETVAAVEAARARGARPFVVNFVEPAPAGGGLA